MKNSYKSFSIVAIICIIIMQLFICFKIVTFEQETGLASLGLGSTGILLGDGTDAPLYEPPALKEEPPQIMYKAYINGAVLNPGVYEFPQGLRIIDLIEIAGGALETANLESINLAAYADDARHIIIPTLGEDAPVSESAVADEPVAKESSSSANEYSKPVYTGVVNINTADIDKLTTLPGIGQTIAQNIINYRNQNGAFTSKEDLKNVSRIGDALYSSIADMIMV